MAPVEDLAEIITGYAISAYKKYKVGEQVKFTVQFGMFPDPDDGKLKFAWSILTCVEGRVLNPNVGRWITQLSYFWQPVPEQRSVEEQILSALEGIRAELAKQSRLPPMTGPSMPLRGPN